MFGVLVDKRRDVFPPAVFIDSVSVVGKIQKEFFDAKFFKISFHSEKGMEEGGKSVKREVPIWEKSNLKNIWKDAM